MPIRYTRNTTADKIFPTRNPHAMKQTRQLLAVMLAALVTITLLVAVGHRADKQAGGVPNPARGATVESRTGARVLIAPSAVRGHRFYFDVEGHSADEFRALLKRAHAIYEQTPVAERADLKVVIVLHGPDVQYVANTNRQRYGDILDLAAKLDAIGVFDFKMCVISAESHQLSAEDLPAFIELVAVAPEEVERLENDGYVRL